MARPTLYDGWKASGELEDKLILVEAWARDGLTQKQIAKNLGINEETLIGYKKIYQEFANALKKGKEVVDIEVENALLKSAKGYNVTLQKTFKIRIVVFDKETGRKIKEYEELRDGREEIHIPANTTAQIFWLKNRKILEWREKQSVTIDSTVEDLTPIADMLKNSAAKDTSAE